MMTQNCSRDLQPGRTRPSLEFLKTYIPGGAASVQTAIWKIAPTADAKISCPDACPPGDAADQLRFTITIGCDKTVEVLYNYDGTKDAAFLCSLIAVLNLSPAVMGAGMFEVDGTNLKFTGFHPGLDIAMTITQTGNHFTVQQISNTPSAAPTVQEFEHGIIVHTPKMGYGAPSAGAMSSLSGRPSAILPSQDPAAANSAQIYAGIAVEGFVKERPQPRGTFPFFGGDCGEVCCPPIDRCVEVFCGPCYEEVELRLDHPLAAGMVFDKLHYRIAPDGDKTKLGRVATAAGPGLIPLPFKFNVLRAQDCYLVGTVGC